MRKTCRIEFLKISNKKVISVINFQMLILFHSFSIWYHKRKYRNKYKIIPNMTFAAIDGAKSWLQNRRSKPQVSGR